MDIEISNQKKVKEFETLLKDKLYSQSSVLDWEIVHFMQIYKNKYGELLITVFFIILFASWVDFSVNDEVSFFIMSTFFCCLSAFLWYTTGNNKTHFYYYFTESGFVK
ncbi:hypothetical protein [Photobacterium sp.]|uniref:hypothetical protein n=1 Tax=Photobacterium sp. TaxID=660 RepID=UPI00299E2934|nr:hypothetical protein [Photobacterium sp.]MDX1302283.1 hypothetical protein [Photobacterium sp.]